MLCATANGRKERHDGPATPSGVTIQAYLPTGRPRYGKATTDMKHVTQKGAEDAGTARRLHHLTRWLRGRRRLAGVLGPGRTGVPRLAGRSAGGGLHRPDGGQHLSAHVRAGRGGRARNRGPGWTVEGRLLVQPFGAALVAEHQAGQ